MLVNILSTEIKERAIILTVKTVGFLARMDNNKWIDGTTVTEDMLTDGVLNLYGKWSQGTAAGIVSFAYSSNSEITTDPLPNSIEFPAGQLVRPSDLPAVPTPSAESTTITGWYIDQTADVLLTEAGIVMPAEGLKLYAKSVSSALVSVSFDYAFGFVPEKTNEYKVPATSESAFDGETLGEANVLPPIITGEEGSAVVLPTPTNLFAGTPLEQRFAGWFDTDTPIEGTKPLTELTLDKDTKAYAMFVPLLPAEKIKITYKVAKIYSPDVVNGQIIPSEEILFTPEEAAALMPALPVETTQNRGEAIDLQNYSWVDEVDRGTNYTLVSPQLATDRTKKFTYIGYYSEFEGQQYFVIVKKYRVHEGVDEHLPMLLFGYIQLAETMEPKHHLLCCDLGCCQLLASNHGFQLFLCRFKFIQSGFCGFVEYTLLDGT